MRIHDEHVCAEVESSLPLYVGGDLDPRALTEVRAHLAACPRCTERALAARAARRELVAALRLADAHGPDLWAGVRSVLGEEGVLAGTGAVGAPRAAAAPRRGWRGLGLAAAAAAVIAAFVAGAYLRSDRVSPVDDPLRTPIVDVAPDAGSVPVVPVADDGGLRRLTPGEGRLRDEALPIYFDQGWLNGLPTNPAGGNQPVTLQRVGPHQRGW